MFALNESGRCIWQALPQGWVRPRVPTHSNHAERARDVRALEERVAAGLVSADGMEIDR